MRKFLLTATLAAAVGLLYAQQTPTKSKSTTTKSDSTSYGTGSGSGSGAGSSSTTMSDTTAVKTDSVTSK
jgi:hypothetical protein